MSDVDQEDWERREAFDELAVVVRLAQEVAQRLTSKTHGPMHSEVAALGKLLHEARLKVETIGTHFEKKL